MLLYHHFFFNKNCIYQTKKNYFLSAPCCKGMNPLLPIPYFTSAPCIYIYIYMCVCVCVCVCKKKYSEAVIFKHDNVPT